MKQKELSFNLHKMIKHDLMANYDLGNIDDGGILGGKRVVDNICDFINNNCFGIYKCNGSWDDYHQWVAYICFDEQEAKDYCENYNKRLDALKEKVMAIVPKDEDGDWNTWDDPKFSRHNKIMDTNHSFYIKLKLL